MAVRFDANGDALTTTANLPAASAFTMMAWFKITTDRNAISCFFNFTNAAATSGAVTTAADGTTLALGINAAQTNGSALSVGTWYHITFWSDGSNVRVYLNGVQDISVAYVAWTPNKLRISDTAAGFFLNGCAAHFKQWDAALSVEEILQEVYSIRPHRTANLSRFCPVFPGSGERGKDYSGNGRDLTEGGTLADEDGPPVAWGTDPIWVQAAGAVTHATTGVLTGQGAALDGTAAHIAKHATSGALAGPGAAITGTAARTRVHATSGVLAGTGAAITGTAARTRVHATSGAPTGPGTTLAGTAARTRQHATSGVLAGQASAIAGSAARSGSAVIHATSGALVGAGATLAGAAARAGSSAVVTGGRRRRYPSLPFFEPAALPARSPTMHATRGALAGAGAAVTAAAGIGPTRSEKQRRKTLLMLLS